MIPIEAAEMRRFFQCLCGFSVFKPFFGTVSRKEGIFKDMDNLSTQKTRRLNCEPPDMFSDILC